MTRLTGNWMVDAIAQINFEGDITPKSWYKHIRYQNKKSGERADHLAVAILADIVYWYRPYQKRDEITSEVIGWGKKFKEDVLRRSPDAFAESLGTTSRCIRESMRLLENLGLIIVTSQPVKTQYGTIPNVMHIEVVPEAIARITHRISPSIESRSTEISLLTKWGTSPNEMRNNALPIRDEFATKSEQLDAKSASHSNEVSNSSIYRDLLEIKETSHQSASEPAHSHPVGEGDIKEKEESQIQLHEDNSSDPVNKTESLHLTDRSLSVDHSSESALKSTETHNNIDEAFLNGRPKNMTKNCGVSVAQDPWMKSSKNPDPEFSVWVFEKRYKAKGGMLADAKAEIRNNSDRASDLWDEYQLELKTKSDRAIQAAQVPVEPVEPAKKKGISMTPEEKQAMLNKIRGIG